MLLYSLHPLVQIADPGSRSIDQVHLLAGWCERPLNQALVLLVIFGLVCADLSSFHARLFRLLCCSWL